MSIKRTTEQAIAYAENITPAEFLSWFDKQPADRTYPMGSINYCPFGRFWYDVFPRTSLAHADYAGNPAGIGIPWSVKCPAWVGRAVQELLNAYPGIHDAPLTHEQVRTIILSYKVLHGMKHGVPVKEAVSV